MTLFSCQTARLRQAASPGAARVPGLPGSRQTKSRLYRRASSPRMSLAPGLAVVVLSVFPDRGVRNVRAKVPRPRRPLARRAARVPFERITAPEPGSAQTSEVVGAEPATEADFHLRSARGWICRPAGCPGVCSLCPRPPFVRTDARTFTRAVRFRCRGLGDNLRGPPHPAPRRDDHRSALRIGTGRNEDNCPWRKKSRTKTQRQRKSRE